MMRHTIAGLLCVFCCVVAGTKLADCQITNVTNDTMTPIEGAGHDYIKMVSETVNPANGGLNLHIDLPVARSRGLTIPFPITYDSNNVHHLKPGYYPNFGTAFWAANNGVLGQGGWTFGIPQLSLSRWEQDVFVITGYNGSSPIYSQFPCFYASSYVLLDLKAQSHALGVASQTGDTSTGQCSGGSFNSRGDGKVLATLTQPLAGGSQYLPSVAVSDDVGTVYSFTVGYGDDAGNGTYALPTSIEDRNGNVTRISPGTGGAVTVTDSSGRTSISTNGFGPSGSTNSIVVSGETFQVTWRTVTANFSSPSTFVGTSGTFTCNPPPVANDSRIVISQITLPNGKFYKFYYGSDITPHGAATNNFGLLNEIDYPSGAWATYSWKLSDTMNELADYPGLYANSCGGSYCPAPAQDGCLYQYKTPVVASRRVSFGTSTPALTQTFVYSTTWGTGTSWTQKATNVTTTDNVTGKSSLTTYTYKPITISSPPYSHTSITPQVAVELSTQYNDWSGGAVLRTVNKDWLDQFDIKLDQTLYYPTGISSQKKYTYNSSGIMIEPLQVDEFDLGASSPTRTTVTNYQSFSGANGTIGAAPCQVLICSAGASCTAASSNKVAETDYLYDGGTAICGASGTAATTQVNGLVSGTHDDTLYGPTSTTPRANVTKITRWLNAGTSPSTTYSYDKTGHVISSVDACGNTACSDVTGTSHTTTYSYGDAFTTLSGGANVPYTAPNGATNSYLTQIVDPLGHTAKFTYDYTNGQLTSAQDQNDINAIRTGAAYIYNDLFARPTQANFADGGQTTVSYNDSSYNTSTNTPNATTNITIKSGVTQSTLLAIDGLGQRVRSQLLTDPDSSNQITTSDTAYDGFGRVLTQSNPYRSTSASTDGTITNSYDALGRVLQITRQDGSIASTSYVDNCRTVTDEAGKSRKSCSDGLGRLTQVFEDPANLNYETDYVYDVLDNLLTVNQKGSAPSNSSLWRTRTFTYDSLSRLFTATNPESGTITYSYDANGNVSSKIAPLPNQTGTATVTTNYSYDVGNRLLGKSYVGMSTAAASYGYDGTAPSGCTPPTLTDSNPIGRRTSMCDASGATSWAHDQMGRTISEIRKIGTVTNTTRYSYNLDGSLASLTYPTGRVVSYTPNTAGRPISATDSTGPINYVSAAQYAAFGGLTSVTNGASIKTTDVFNSRLQPCWLYATTGTALPTSTLCTGTATTGTIQDVKYNFGLGTNDNGNVLQIVNNRDGNRTQNFLYDSMNRIAQAYTNGTNWGETFSPNPTAPGVLPTTSGIDAWGNMTNRTSVTGKTNYELLNVPALSNNRLSGFGYDAAGNMTSNGSSTYTYDAENRMTATAGCTFTYDGDGNRVLKTGCAGVYYWRDLSGNPLEESIAATIQFEYVFFGGKRVARRDVATNTVHYFFSDHLGSTSLITNASGVMPPESESDYYPYGGEIVVSSPTIQDQNYKFTGKERDRQSGLDNFGARYDSSALGRFMTPDWAAKPTTVPYASFGDPQTLNLYAYLANLPVNRVDADGHCPPDGGSNGSSTSSCPTLRKEDVAAIKVQVDNSNKPTTDDKKGKNHETAVITGKDEKGGHAIVPAKPGAYSDVTKKGQTVEVNPSEAADPAQQKTIVTPEVVAHVHPAGTVTTTTTNGDGQTVQTTHYWNQPPSGGDLKSAIPAPGINVIVGAGTYSNVSKSPTVYFFNSSGTTCTESYENFLKSAN
jgi:RHS repeat-associated protein